MDRLKSLNHTVWDCKYHVVWIQKFWRKVIFGQLREYLGEVIRELAMEKGSRVEEDHLMLDHIHMLILIPPKYSVSQVIGSIKGKSAIHIARVSGGRKKNFTGEKFWARGCFVSTVGKDEAAIRE